tara:strand:- start:4969 stop:5916 length:948 start_codon:yes stop_codon:yes gene_type:complete
MITYNNIVNRFERFVADHLLLKTFTHGSPSGVDLDKFEVYPALHLVYTGATYVSTSKEYSFEVYILDLPPDKAKKIENQQQLVSNAEQVAEDILADMMNGDNVFHFSDLYTVTSANSTPLEETTSNSLAGILLSISIEVGYAFDSCNAPLKGVTPSGSQIPSGGGGTISTIHYTSDADTAFVVGTTQIRVPQIDDGNWLTSNINLNKSISLIQSSISSRSEIHGINSSAAISGDLVFDVIADSAGIVSISLVTSGAAFAGTVSHTFATAGKVTLTISGSTINQISPVAYFGASILSSTTGTVTLSSVQFTINNQF